MAHNEDTQNDARNENAADPWDVAVERFDNRGYRESLGGVNPTGASAFMVNERGETQLVGKCMRAVWYSKKKVPRTNPPTEANIMKFLMGCGLEDYVQEMWAGAGVLLGSNIKIRQNIAASSDDPEIMLSGEVDALLRYSEYVVGDDGVRRLQIDPTKAIGIEVKTSYGHWKQKQLGGNEVYDVGFPQIEHLMQTALYLHTRHVLEDYYGVEIPFFVITYLLRDSGFKKSFRVELSDGYEGRIVVKTMDGVEIKPNAAMALKWNCNISPINLTIEMMRERFAQTVEALKSDTPPARDFSLRYSDAEAERLFDLGTLSKTKWATFQKDSLAEVGDWNCSYCDWKDVCYPQGIFTVDVENGTLTIDEALSAYGIGGGSN